AEYAHRAFSFPWTVSPVKLDRNITARLIGPTAFERPRGKRGQVSETVRQAHSHPKNSRGHPRFRGEGLISSYSAATSASSA
ncbi:hypothetical protein ACC740_37795, partial [Rhizobium ruizarguesonis]